jgi:hypothetical protein
MRLVTIPDGWDIDSEISAHCSFFFLETNESAEAGRATINCPVPGLVTALLKAANYEGPICGGSIP